MEKKSSDAKIRANAKYNATHYDRMTVSLEKDLSTEFTELIEKLQLSKNAAIKQAIIEYIERHKPIN